MLPDPYYSHRNGIHTTQPYNTQIIHSCLASYKQKHEYFYDIYRNCTTAICHRTWCSTVGFGRYCPNLLGNGYVRQCSISHKICTLLHWCHIRVKASIMTSSNGNIFRDTGPLCGEITGHRWIPLTKASDAELWCFIWSVPEHTVE